MSDEGNPFRFELGGWVQPIMSPNTPPSTIAVSMQVIERQLQECPAGSQVWYTCRHHVLESRGIEWTGGGELRKYNDIELEACEPRAARPVVDRESLMRRLSRILSQMEEGTPNEPS